MRRESVDRFTMGVEARLPLSVVISSLEECWRNNYVCGLVCHSLGVMCRHLYLILHTALGVRPHSVELTEAVILHLVLSVGICLVANGFCYKRHGYTVCRHLNRNVANNVSSDREIIMIEVLILKSGTCDRSFKRDRC
ncbi:hypothetical protein CGRA01v4_14932 [Colletotrichum graminicola]|nr:hypothetical protein CGRA01v4_14932 [Colletotrichum graminicola]